MKKFLMTLGVLVILVNSQAQAQEKGPLAMQTMFYWTITGSLIGAVLGTAVWMTDPGNPNVKMSASLLEGAAWGTLFGAGFGLYVLNQTYIPPAGATPSQVGEMPMPSGLYALHPTRLDTLPEDHFRRPLSVGPMIPVMSFQF
ncbi:MAG: hypothetical protein OEV94_03170 [Deltaproteobacteria bacterium]|nr:hypothetical protein [Deltaproteobacteria bacterium]